MNQTVSSVTAAVGKQMENLYKQSSFDQYEFTGILNRLNELSEIVFKIWFFKQMNSTFFSNLREK